MRYSSGYGFYELNPFPGCNQLVVSNHAFINAGQRLRGFGSRAHQERLNEARRLGYDAAICTVRAGNQSQIAILKKFKWTKLTEFHSTEANHTIEIWFRQLSDIVFPTL